jgi:hypothetical protein
MPVSWDMLVMLEPTSINRTALIFSSILNLDIKTAPPPLDLLSNFWGAVQSDFLMIVLGVKTNDGTWSEF